MKVITVNLGEIIRQKVEEARISKAQFAKALNIQRQNIEKTVFQKHSLDTDLLCAISNYLGCNLFNYFIDADNTTDDRKVAYSSRQVANVTVSIEMGAEKHDKQFTVLFGDNKLKLE